MEVTIYIFGLFIVSSFGIAHEEWACPNEADLEGVISQWPIIKLSDRCTAAYSTDGCEKGEWLVPLLNGIKPENGITQGSCQKRQCPENNEDNFKFEQIWALHEGNCVLIGGHNVSLCGNTREKVLLDCNGRIYCAKEPEPQGRGLWGYIWGVPKKVVGSMSDLFFGLRGY